MLDGCLRAGDGQADELPRHGQVAFAGALPGSYTERAITRSTLSLEAA